MRTHGIQAFAPSSAKPKSHGEATRMSPKTASANRSARIVIAWARKPPS